MARKVFANCARITLFTSIKPDSSLSSILKNINDNSLVLLIDEYDAPLTHHINQNDEINEIINILNDFYATIKQYTGKFRFIFITGITRTSHVSIFSAFNNIIDISLENDYNELLGFTKNDLEYFFDEYILHAAITLKISKQDIYDKLEEYYDGFQFSLQATSTIYNPWSILNFLTFPKNGFKNYWFSSGGQSSLIMQYLKINNSFDFLNPNNREVDIDEEDISNRYDITDIPRNVLLYQTGYLTLRHNQNDFFKLVLPNKEVEESLFRLYLKVNNLDPKHDLLQKMKTIVKAIDTHNISYIIDIFNDILNECVSPLSNIFQDERSLRDIIYAALMKAPALQIVKERETVRGRSDLEMLTEKTHLVIELKRASDACPPERAFKKALGQIQEKRYGKLFSEKRERYALAMVIASTEKKVLPQFCQEVPLE